MSDGPVGWFGFESQCIHTMIIARYRMVYVPHEDIKSAVTQEKNLISRETYTDFVKTKMAEYDSLMSESNDASGEKKKALRYQAGLVKKEIKGAVGDEFFVVGSPMWVALETGWLPPQPTVENDIARPMVFEKL